MDAGIIGLDDRGNPVDQLLLWHGADLGRGHLAVLEQHQGRNPANAVFLRRRRVMVDIDLGDLQLALEIGRDFLQRRRNHFARAAPFGPEIDQHRPGRFQDVGIEG